MTPSRRDFVLGVSGVALSGCERDPKLTKNTQSAVTSGLPPSLPPNEAARGAGQTPEETVLLSQRRLGRTGELVSLLGLGGFHIGKPKEEADGIRLVRSAVDAGVTFLDNCWDYHDGESEKRMGKALRDGYRKRVFLMTKLDGRTRAAATAQLEQSLQRLQTDVIDLVQVHEVIRDTDPARCFGDDGVIGALRDAQVAGKLRFIGFTGHKHPKIHLAMLRAAEAHSFRFDTVQMPLNVFDAHYRSFEREVLPLLVAQNIGVLGMKSMGDGSIVKSGIATPEECLRYSLSLPTSVVISGMDSADVLGKNLEVARSFRPFTAAERDELLKRTRTLAADGKYESFKTSHDHDGTIQHPHWLEEARI